jgi:hypothetical protein
MSYPVTSMLPRSARYSSSIAAAAGDTARTSSNEVSDVTSMSRDSISARRAASCSSGREVEGDAPTSASSASVGSSPHCVQAWR